MSARISNDRRRHVLALLLAAFGVLTAVSLATYQAPLPFASPWSAPNACGPVGALLAYSLVWTFGYAAAFGVPLLAFGWSWNRARRGEVRGLLVRSAIGGLLAFEICTLLGLGALDRWRWSGGWGVAFALALHSALGAIGSWIVGGTLFFATALVASELGFHW
ncbi:MAG: hypothetical protein HOP12_07335, partial [Candidatus Eisenbacteria bacterium]|nr:hypothetical protein [Candidatus Eisenbacteria bacterium]